MVVLVVFLPVLRHGFICYDDNGYVTANPQVQSGLNWTSLGWAFHAVGVAYWHPLTWISHLIDVDFYGLNPRGHHLTSALLHAVNALLVFVVIRELTGAFWRSWFVAALFGLHPLHVESVAWVAERKDVLSTLFWLLSIWCYTRWIRQRAKRTPRAGVMYGLSLLFFAAGLMSKPMVVTLPCVLLLLDFWPLNRWGRSPADAASVPLGRLLMEKLPFFSLSVAASIVTVSGQSSIGAILTIDRIPWLTRVANALVSYVVYLEKCFYPARLAVFYPYPERPPVWAAAFSGALLVGLTLTALVLWRKKPYLITGWLWYLGTLVPVIGFVQVGGQAMADRYSYVPLLGIFIAGAWAVADWTRDWARRSYVLGPAAGAVLAASVVLTSRQLGYWQNSETLFRHALAVTENNWCGHMGLGYALAEDPARLDEAITEYRASVRLLPNYAEPHFSLGAVLARKPDGLAEAIAEYQTAVRIRPDYLQAHAALAKALAPLPSRLADAAAEYESAVRLAPDDPDLHNNLADLLAQLPERLPEAITEYRTVLRLRPDWVEVRSNLGNILQSIPGRLTEAIAEYQMVIRAKPDFAEAHNNLANALAQMPDRLAEAGAEYEAAIRVRPGYFEAEYNYGVLLSRMPGRIPEAIGHFEAALKIKPDLAPARTMLDQLRANQRP